MADRPFAPPPRPSVTQRVKDLFRLDSRDEHLEAEEIQALRDYVSWSSMRAHKVFLRWLEEQGNAPAKIGDHMTMIASNARLNAFKEIRQFLVDREKRSILRLEEVDG